MPLEDWCSTPVFNKSLVTRSAIPKGKTLYRLVSLGDCAQERTTHHHQRKHASEILSDSGPPCRLYLGSDFPASQCWRAHTVLSFDWLSLASLGLFGPTKPWGNTKYDSNKWTTNHQRKKSRKNKHILSTVAMLQEDYPNPSRKNILNKTRSMVCKSQVLRSHKGQGFNPRQGWKEEQAISPEPKTASFTVEENLMWERNTKKNHKNCGHMTTNTLPPII